MNFVSFKNSATPLVTLANKEGEDGIEIEVRGDDSYNEPAQVTSSGGGGAAVAAAATAAAPTEAAAAEGNPTDDSSSLTVGQKRRLLLRRRMSAEERIRDYNRRLALIAVIFVIVAVDMALFLRIAPPLKRRLRRTIAGCKMFANNDVEAVTAKTTPPTASTGSAPTRSTTDHANALLSEYQNLHGRLREKALKDALYKFIDDEFLPQ